MHGRGGEADFFANRFGDAACVELKDVENLAVYAVHPHLDAAKLHFTAFKRAAPTWK
jgi:hypothetical protein